VSALDERILGGMADQLALRRERLAAGERPIGWKLGFGAPPALERFGLDRPLVGFLTDRGLLADGAEADVGGWANPMLEPEVAVHLASDVPPGASWEDVRAAVGGLSPAIELADLDPPPEDVRAVLAGNIYHRHVLLGPVDRSRSTGEGLRGRLLRDGEVAAEVDDPEALTGEIVEVIRLAGEVLEACGERLRAGEVVITGSIVPPVPVRPGERLEAEIEPLGRVAVQVTSRSAPVRTS
jgi:2-keto-4-pentenoate hydratase